MAILSNLERKTTAGRLLCVALYLFAVSGGISMLIPFTAMVGDSLRSNADTRFQGDSGILPSYLFDDSWLWRKYLFAKYGSLHNVNKIKKRGTVSYIYSRDIEKFSADSLSAAENKQIRDYREFMEEYAPQHLSQFYVAFTNGSAPLNLSCWLTSELFIDFLKKRYGDILQLNKVYYENNTDWTDVAHLQEPLALREWHPNRQSQKSIDWYDFKKTLSAEYLLPANIDERFAGFLKNKGYLKIKNSQRKKNSLSDKTPDSGYESFRLRFIQTRVPLRFLTLQKVSFVRWLQKRYGAVANFNKAANEKLKDWSEVIIPVDFGIKSILFDNVLKDFIKQMGFNDFTLSLPKLEFRRFLKAKYITLEKLNSSYGVAFKRWNELKIPLKLLDEKQFVSRKNYFRLEFIKRNFVIISGYLLTNGRAFYNTFVLVFLTVFFALTVNPLCAYALSRFNMKFAHQILLFCLATMAFPPEVTMIPSFLMLKEFSLLNSFPALFLPGVANGFSIFLLKGFFDSLPDELFDAAKIDGCSETMMFWRIALPLTTPILAVISLNAFAGAYGGFLWAYIVCPDSKYWTIMVYLNALSKMGAGVGIQSAGFILATIPTLVVFLLAQKVILKGIVIPQMK